MSEEIKLLEEKMGIAAKDTARFLIKAAWSAVLSFPIAIAAGVFLTPALTSIIISTGVWVVGGAFCTCAAFSAWEASQLGKKIERLSAEETRMKMFQEMFQGLGVRISELERTLSKFNAASGPSALPSSAEPAPVSAAKPVL